MIKRLVDRFNRKPLPRNLRALRSCRVSYSQFAEDPLLSELLGASNRDGLYVDVGCYHPIDYSNTYIFYQRGWRGLAVDPNPAWRDAWQRFRPRDRFVNCAVSSAAGAVSYVMNRVYPACNRLLPAGPDAVKLGPDESLASVSAQPLHALLGEFLPAGPFDLLTVDCEGHDLTVLQTHDFERWPARVIAAEDGSINLDTPLNQFLAAKGYACRAFMGHTKIFERRA